MPTVYVSQVPHKHDHSTGTFVPAYNIGPAVEHGQVRLLFPPRAPFTDPDQFMPQLKTALASYNYAAGDSLLLLGDAVVSAAMVALVAMKGDFRILRWDRNVGRYLPITVSLPLATV